MFLPGDVNSDGILTEEDTEIIESEALGVMIYTTYWQLYIAQIYISEELNNKMFTNSAESSLLDELREGCCSYIDILECLYAYEAENNYVHDGVNYFTNDALRQYAEKRFNSL